MQTNKNTSLSDKILALTLATIKKRLLNIHFNVTLYNIFFILNKINLVGNQLVTDILNTSNYESLFQLFYRL